MKWALLAKRIVTADATPLSPVGAVENAVLEIDGDRIVGLLGSSETHAKECVIDVGTSLVTPGWVDAHTHAAWTGSRHEEYVARMLGGDYEAIAKAGGGIHSTQRAVSAASERVLANELASRLARMASLGVTTVEVKSGYGLEEAHELKQLRAIALARGRTDLPRVVPTFLALHALPAGAVGTRAEYIERVAELVSLVRREQLAEFVDAYIDRNAFSVDEARAVCRAAKLAGLGIRLHVGQFSDIGGAELAAEVGASSADHLEVLGESGIRALAEARVFAGLLPVACFTLRQSPPPIDALRRAGVRFVVASDANPGTAPTESLPLALALAVRLFGLTPAEALLGVTRHAAESLGLGSSTGVLARGYLADLVVWDVPHEHALLQPWGVSRARAVLRGGRVLFDPEGLFAALKPPEVT